MKWCQLVYVLFVLKLLVDSGLCFYACRLLGCLPHKLEIVGFLCNNVRTIGSELSACLTSFDARFDVG